jgi:hypothetical protein
LAASLLCAAKASAAQYPVTARIVVTPEVEEACLVQWKSDCLLRVGDRLRRSYEEVARAMFEAPPGAEADLEIVVTPIRADLTNLVQGGRLVVETRAVILGAGGAEIAAVRSEGESTLLGAEIDSLSRAADRAIADVARAFEKRFTDSESMVEWLLARDISPAGSFFVWPRRGDWLAFADVDITNVMGGGDGATTGWLAQFGLSNRWFMVRGVVGKWTPSFFGAGPGADIRFASDLSTTDLGVEAGPILRIGPAVELRAGMGVHRLWGTANGTPSFASSAFELSFDHISPAFFAAVQTSFWPSKGGVRMRAGLEARRYVSTTVGFPQLSRTIPIADTSIGVYLGVELPMGSKPARAKP